MFKKVLFAVISFLFFFSFNHAQNNPQKEFDLLKQISEKGSWQFRNFEVILEFPQLVDHNNPDGPTFNQRVFIKHRDFSKPVGAVS